MLYTFHYPATESSRNSFRDWTEMMYRHGCDIHGYLFTIHIAIWFGHRWSTVQCNIIVVKRNQISRLYPVLLLPTKGHKTQLWTRQMNFKTYNWKLQIRSGFTQVPISEQVMHLNVYSLIWISSHWLLVNRETIECAVCFSVEYSCLIPNIKPQSSPQCPVSIMTSWHGNAAKICSTE